MVRFNIASFDLTSKKYQLWLDTVFVVYYKSDYHELQEFIDL